MATLLFQAAGATLGGFFGPFGAMLGRAVGALAGSAVDRSLLGGMTKIPGARLNDGRVPGAEEGTAMSRVYGTARVGGTLIWATRFEEDVSVERAGGKASGPRVETFSYFANFAVGVCEGPIAGIRRVFADGREIDLTGIEMRVHRGTADQAPDPLILAKQGAGNAPAYRGLAYVVFERLPLDTFGNRIPILQFEVLRPVGSLEGKVRAVTLIPGSSEHGYDPQLVTERIAAGKARNMNRNTLVAATDWVASIDELQALCPGLERVGLVVAWFTELGCPAVDKGPNQPNVFVDPKSSENALPYHSGGARNDSIQRRFLDVHHGWWQGDGPEAGMVDPGHVFVWTWDARPYPAFPEDTALWSDGLNWQRGHWLNARLGAGTVADVIAAILKDHGFHDFDVSGVAGDLSGFVQADQTSARALIEPLMEAFQIDALEANGRLVFRSRLKSALPPAQISVLAERPEEALFEESRGHLSDFAGEAILDHFDDSGTYARVTARSRRMAGENNRVLRLALPAVLHAGAAAASVEAALRDQRAGQRRLTFRLPPTAMGVTPGDIVRLADGPEGRFLVTGVTDGLVREVEARAIAAGESPAPLLLDGRGRPVGGAGPGPGDGFAPDVVFLDLPVLGSGGAQDFARVAAYAQPWRSMIVSSSGGSEGYRSRVRLDRPARIGTLVAPLAAGVVGRFDPGRAVVLDLPSGGLSAVETLAMLNGANRLAIRAGNGAWEIIGFAGASEIAPGRWRLTGLLRALNGTEDAMASGHAAGARAVVLDDAVVPLGLDVEEVGRPSNWLVEPVGMTPGQAGPFVFAGGERALTPLAPVHLRGQRNLDGAVRLSWIRRGRIDSDSWLAAEIPLDEPVEAYRLDILSGETAVRSVETSAPAFTYPVVQELADFGAPQAALSIRVRQLGRAIPLGLPARATITL